MDTAPIEYSVGLTHFGMKTFMMPPAGIAFLGVTEIVQVAEAPTVAGSAAKDAVRSVSGVNWAKKADEVDRSDVEVAVELL
jgi:hypothetical protein